MRGSSRRSSRRYDIADRARGMVDCSEEHASETAGKCRLPYAREGRGTAPGLNFLAGGPLH